MDFADYFVVDDPSDFVILLEGNLLRISLGLEVILGYFCFAKFGELEISFLILFIQGMLELSGDYFIMLSVLELFWNRQNPLFL